MCKCDCGTIKEVAANHLKSGAIQSCGCLNNELRLKRNAESHISLVGQKFGLLTVIEDKGFDKTRHLSMSTCMCDCGNQVIVSNNNLTQGITMSCGCLKMSHGELTIKQLLDQYNILYKQEYIPNNLSFKGRYDFAILNTDNEVLYFIEYDGKQHFNTYKGIYQVNREHDRIKNDYCYKTGIPLIRIPYTVKDIKIEDL